MSSTSWIEFENYLSQYSKGEVGFNGEKVLPLCIVLGAGIHRLVEECSTGKEYESRNALASWDGLLDRLGSSKYDAPTPTLRWEMKVIESDYFADKPDIAANKKEKILKKNCNKIIDSSENILVQNGTIIDQYLPLKKVLQSPLLNDVISFNLDLMIERLLSSSKNKFKNTSIKKSNRCRVVNRSEGNTDLRIWHPHGDRESIESVSLGVWRYQQVMTEIDQFRKYFKRNEKRNYEELVKNVRTDPNSWVDIYMTRPLLFIGTSLDPAEWGHWYALLIRWRNYARRSNKHVMPPMWRLCVPNDGLHLPKDKFSRLEGADYKEAWKFLVDVFERCEKLQAK